MYIQRHAFITSASAVAGWDFLVRVRQIVFPIRRQAMERPLQNRAGAGAGGELEMVGRAAGNKGLGDAAAGSAEAEVA